MKPFYCLFFSFKGGVGRTSALMNTALYLSSRKKKVLVIDLDIHAPGIDIFNVPPDGDVSQRLPSYHPIKIYRHFKTNGLTPVKDPIVSGSPFIKSAPSGFVEYCIEWQNRYEQFVKNRVEYPTLPDLEDPGDIRDTFERNTISYLYRLPVHKMGDGPIFIMRAGNHDDKDKYQELLKQLKPELIDPGYNLSLEKRVLKRDILDIEESGRGEITALDRQLSGLINPYPTPVFVEEFKKKIAGLGVDYVLVDSRPGVDWVANLAMTWFSQCMVLAFNYNPWNLQGIINVFKEVRKGPLHRGLDGEPHDHPNILLVATPIPRYAKSNKLYDDQDLLIQTQMTAARNSGYGAKPRPVEVPYADILTLQDVLITDAEPNDPAVKAYQRLGHLIISGNDMDIENRIQAVFSENDTEKVIAAFDRQVGQSGQEYEIPLVFEYGKYLYKAGRYTAAEVQLNSVWSHFERQLGEWAIPAKTAQTSETGPYFDPFFQDTLKYRVRVKLALVRDTLIRERQKILSNWDKAAIDISREGLTSLEVMLQKFVNNTQSSSLKTGFAELHALLGEVYFRLAELVSMNEIEQEARKKLLEQSIASFNKALLLDQSNAEFLHGLAESRGALALLNATDSSLFDEAIQTFEKTQSLKSDSPDSYLLCGSYRMAQAVSVEEEGVRLPMYLFLPHPPYVSESYIHNEKKNDWMRNRRLEINKDLLKKAEEDLSEAISLRSYEYMAYFNRGMVRGFRSFLALEDLNHRKDASVDVFDVVKSLLNSAITDFDRTTIYNPLYSPAYFYSGMMQFILMEEEVRFLNVPDRDKKTFQELRKRQAFYRLEHFIDKELERILKLDKATNVRREEFYFNGETEIPLILIGAFDFLRTIEIQLDFPPLTEIIREKLYPNKTFAFNKKFLEFIKNHFGTDKP